MKGQKRTEIRKSISGVEKNPKYSPPAAQTNLRTNANKVSIGNKIKLPRRVI